MRAEPTAARCAVPAADCGWRHEAARQATRITDRSAEVVRNAAAFFIEQILLAPGRRQLSRARQATRTDQQQRTPAQYGLLFKWLHPDMSTTAMRPLDVCGRVTLAWDNLKTPERRAAYDQERRALQSKTPVRQDKHRRGRSEKPTSRLNRGIPRRRDSCAERCCFSLAAGGLEARTRLPRHRSITGQAEYIHVSRDRLCGRRRASGVARGNEEPRCLSREGGAGYGPRLAVD